MKDLLIEEINRIRSLIGNNQNSYDLIYEQAGRFFKKAWDDFVATNPTSAKKFDINQIKNFIETDIKSLDSLFKHIESNSQIWKAIGIPESSITVMQALKKNIIDKKNPSILFRESSNGKYFFEYVPVEGGLRGELFYWYSKSYPKDWVEGLKSLPDVEKPKTKNLVALDNTKIDAEPDLSPVVVNKTKVRVDKNGNPVDFNSLGKPIDVDGNEVKLLSDGKVDTSLAIVEKIDTSNLPVIKVDENGKPIVKNENGIAIDEAGNTFDIGDDGRPSDDERPRTDDEGNTVNNQGDPLDDVGNISRERKKQYKRTEELWLFFKEYWPSRALFFERFSTLVADYMDRPRMKRRIVDTFNEDLNAAIQQHLYNYDPNMSPEILRRKIFYSFLELQRVSQRKLSPEFLIEIKDKVLKIELEGLTGDARMQKSRYLDEFWNNLINMEDGLGELFKLMDKDKDISSSITGKVKSMWRTGKEFWIVGDLTITQSDKWWNAKALQYVGAYTGQMVKRLWRQFLFESPFTSMEYQRQLMRGGYSTSSVFMKYAAQQFVSRVILPVVIGTGYYLFWADGVPFGGFKRMGEDTTDYDLSDGDKTSIWKDYIIPVLKKRNTWESDDDYNLAMKIVDFVTSITPTGVDDTVLLTIGALSKSEESKKEDKKPLPKITQKEDIKYTAQIHNAEKDRRLQVEQNKIDLSGGWVYTNSRKDEFSDEQKEDMQAKIDIIKELLTDNGNEIKTKKQLDENKPDTRPMFTLANDEVLYLNRDLKDIFVIEKEDGTQKTPLLDFINGPYSTMILNSKPKKETNEGIESLFKTNNYKYITKKMMMENNGKKFGEDNFKHWKETFTFKSEDKGNPGQFKEIKIKMEDVMDRIDHYRKKYDEDDSFVRAVVDTHPDVVKIMYTKGLADINESATPRGLALVLRVIKESRGEMEIFSVARPANGNWFLVKGDYTQSQLANMDLEKKEPKNKEEKKEVSGSEELKKKEQTAIDLLKRNEREGLNDLPTKVREKLREKMGKGWTTEPMPSFLNKIATESEINTIFNDKIEIYKLESNDGTFDAIVDNSSQIFIKRGFCRSLYVAADDAKLSEKQEKVINHILDKCDKKYLGKLGVRNF